MRERLSIWQILTPPSRCPSLDRSAAADVVIVGAGIVGLSASIQLRRHQFFGRIVLVEQKTIGAGATGRSGGILYADDEFLPGSIQHYLLLKTFLAELGLAHLITSGRGQLAGVEGEDDTDVVNPQLLANELGACARKLGVEIYQDSEVQSWEEVPGGVVLRVNDYEVEARAALLATGAYTAASMAETLHLDVREEDCVAVEAPGAKIPWTYAGSVGAGDFVWGRRIGNDQFLFGGGDRYSLPRGLDSARLAHVLGGLNAFLPGFRSARVIAHWSGMLCRFRDSRGWRVTPVPGRERVLFAGGFDGQGLLAGSAAGLQAAANLIRLL